MDESRDVLAILSRLGQELEPGGVVCLVHRRFPPCRRDVECQYSADPDDVASISEWQRGGWALPGC